MTGRPPAGAARGGLSRRAESDRQTMSGTDSRLNKAPPCSRQCDAEQITAIVSRLPFLCISLECAPIVN